MTMAAESGTIYVVELQHYQAAFADRAHAEAVARQWDADHAEQVAFLRGDDCERLADELIARINEWPQEKWAWKGPGGMDAVWHQMPDRQYVHSRSASFNGDCVATFEAPVFSRWVWEFQEGGYTDEPSVWWTDRRPGRDVRVEAWAKGTDLDAVEAAFAKAQGEARRLCEIMSKGQ